MTSVHISYSAIRWRLLVMGGIVLVAAALQVFDVLDWRDAFAWSQAYAGTWWLPLALVLIQVILFAFALYGSAVLWLTASLYPPVVSTPLLVAGTVLGGVAAYALAQVLSVPWKRRMMKSRLFLLLQEHSDFLTLCALRTFPGFPQSIINYSSGILHVPIGRFVLSAVLGLSVKIYLYAQLVHGIVQGHGTRTLVRADTIAPLAVLCLLFVLARIFKHRWSRR